MHYDEGRKIDEETIVVRGRGKKQLWRTTNSRSFRKFFLPERTKTTVVHRETSQISLELVQAVPLGMALAL